MIKGVMNEAAGEYAGLDRFECRKKIVADLERLGFLDKIEDYDHAVGNCYRCKTVIEPTTSLQWFVSVKPLAEKAVAAVQRRTHKHISENLVQYVLQLDGQYPGLVYFPSDLVGTPDSCLDL